MQYTVAAVSTLTDAELAEQVRNDVAAASFISYMDDRTKQFNDGLITNYEMMMGCVAEADRLLIEVSKGRNIKWSEPTPSKVRLLGMKKQPLTPEQKEKRRIGMEAREEKKQEAFRNKYLKQSKGW